MNLKEKAKRLPEVPGVYLMKDSQGSIIYIGKAKSLKARVSQYFQSAQRHAPKIARMLEAIRDFDYIMTDTELEALLLECRLIKDIKPMYNSQLKNHKKYIYIKVVNEINYPTLEIVEERQAGNLCFGPYTSKSSVQRGIMAIEEGLKLRQCRMFSNRKSGCLNYELGTCIAPCTGKIPIEVYKQYFDQAIDFLAGRKPDLIKLFEENMIAAAEDLNFIRAAKYRDDITALKHLLRKMQTISFSQNNRCIIAIEKTKDSDHKLFIIKGSSIIYKQTLLLWQDNSELSKKITELIMMYIEELKNNEAITVDKQDIDQAQIIFSYLRSTKGCSHAAVPKSWLNNNAIYKLEKNVTKLVEKLNV